MVMTRGTGHSIDHEEEGPTENNATCSVKDGATGTGRREGGRALLLYGEGKGGGEDRTAGKRQKISGLYRDMELNCVKWRGTGVELTGDV